MEICYRTKELEKTTTAICGPSLKTHPEIKGPLALFFHIVSAATKREDILCFSSIRILPNSNNMDYKVIFPKLINVSLTVCFCKKENTDEEYILITEVKNHAD